MRSFSYGRADSVQSAVKDIAGNQAAPDAANATVKLVAGGTNLLDLMKADVMRPVRLVDITRLPLKTIEETAEGGLRLGALMTNADTAYDERVQARYPMLSKAILAGASAQLRNMATNGGNLLQRTRCYYFYDTATPCNKREPGSGCGALHGVNRIHAILGVSEHCIAVHPSDMAVALAALDATVRVTGPGGERAIPIGEFHRLPGDTPHIDTTLRADEIITGIELPAQGFAAHSTYLKARDRASYAFALISAAVALELDGGTIREARLALGGVAHKPWRDRAAEAALAGQPATRDSFRAMADAVLRDAKGYEHNSFKIDLARSVILRAFEEAAGLEPS
ncbi:xanthine dehydrogenase family protein subunit M [Azospirillum sp. SYSU D00513]|uniref:FAD binding domain-containing protein n=1 Tax=Azospirillum sp. SYSU D00513 TaxID=2812561 RepID=UPI001A95D589|nr:xanthine dehydrogenase family protein subunit M [Azospirillum sp. SYSU D00513]